MKEGVFGSFSYMLMLKESLYSSSTRFTLSTQHFISFFATMPHRRGENERWACDTAFQHEIEKPILSLEKIVVVPYII